MSCRIHNTTQQLHTHYVQNPNMHETECDLAGESGRQTARGIIIREQDPMIVAKIHIIDTVDMLYIKD